MTCPGMSWGRAYPACRQVSSTQRPSTLLRFLDWQWRDPSPPSSSPSPLLLLSAPVQCYSAPVCFACFCWSWATQLPKDFVLPSQPQALLAMNLPSAVTMTLCVCAFVAALGAAMLSFCARVQQSCEFRRITSVAVQSQSDLLFIRKEN